MSSVLPADLRERFRDVKVLVSSFTCKAKGKSETYVGYKWLEQIARFCDTTLVTADDEAVSDQWRKIQTCRQRQYTNKLIRRINGEVSFDYFRFNYRNARQFKNTIAEYDLVHHVMPVAPRYPNALGCMARKFILGPVGGGLRAPDSFRSEVEGHEEWFYKLRALDRARFDFDPFLRRTYNAADLILLVGSYMYDLLPERYHHKCQVLLEVGVEANEYKATRPLSASNSEPLKLLYAGRIVPYKGLIYALRALERLPAEAKGKIEFTIIGDRGESGYEQACKDFVKTHRLEKIVTFLPFKPKHEVLEYYNQSDLFVFPSLAEAGGTVVLEALAMGRPVLAVRRGGPAESVLPEAGFLIDPRDPEYLVDRIKETFLEVLANRELIVAKGAGARKTAEDRFDWSKKGEALMAIYERVLGQRVASKAESKLQPVG
ncbi:MAG TPA: glycosyltransferase family 4 protein [Candidatus Angelobacter sp.]|nr:glycosyltransferase family 4 protein [Candidatus Angelobacter sp.]